MTIRVLVADDQELVRTGLSMILGAQPDIEVVGQAVDGREALAMARELRPDVCLFDIRIAWRDRRIEELRRQDVCARSEYRFDGSKVRPSGAPR